MPIRRFCCDQCGTSLSAGSHDNLCGPCRNRTGPAVTVTHRPGDDRPSAADGGAGPAAGSSVDLREFRRMVAEIGLISDQELDRFSVPDDNVSRLAGALVRAGNLTNYQAAALMQGKGKGLMIGPYLILDKRGQGGMGVVFKARHRPTSQTVALKVLPPSFGRDRDAVLRFRREVEIAARIDHPNVVKALDASEDRGVHFLAMEFIEGQDLEALVSSGGPLPIELAIHCTIVAARGMEARAGAGDRPPRHQASQPHARQVRSRPGARSGLGPGDRVSQQWRRPIAGRCLDTEPATTWEPPISRPPNRPMMPKRPTIEPTSIVWAVRSIIS